MTTTKEKIAVMQAYVDGKEIEFNRKGFADFHGVKKESEIGVEPSWNWIVFEYRIKPAEPDSIDWNAVHPDYNWLARDSCGRAWLYNSNPYIRDGSDMWSGACECASTHVLSSYKQGNAYWSESLVERPSAQGDSHAL